MCKDGLVYGVGTEDMDALTFGTPILIRHMSYRYVFFFNFIVKKKKKKKLIIKQ